MSGLRLTEASPQNEGPKKSTVEKLREMLNSNEGGGEVVLKLDTPAIRDRDGDVEPDPLGYEFLPISEPVPNYTNLDENGSGPDEVLGVENADPFGALALDSHVIGLLVDNGIPDEATLRQEVAAGRDLTKIKGIGKVTQQEILDALVETDA